MLTPRFQVTIEVNEAGCRLLGPSEPELKALSQETLVPGELLRRLQESGILLNPTDDDAKNLDREDVILKPTPKSSLVESFAYQNIAGISGAFSVKWSKWNQSVSSDEAVVLVKETMEPFESPDDVHEVWSSVLDASF